MTLAQPPANIDALSSEIAAELNRVQPQAITDMAEACCERFAGHVEAVLFYGSCLRTGKVRDQVLDFYILVDSYRKAHSSMISAVANRLLPPNVYYREIDVAGEDGEPVRVRAKYAVLSVDDFIRRARGDVLNISIWARFSQPSSLMMCDDEAVRQRLVSAISEAHRVMISAAMIKGESDPRTLWTRAFDRTYGAELRSEKQGKGQELYELDQARYDQLMPHILASLDHENLPASPSASAWFWRGVNGKAVSLFRLIKGAFTFDGGIDYLAWKISRHSGVQITPTPWQRRHPVIAGLMMFIRLRRRGAFR